MLTAAVIGCGHGGRLSVEALANSDLLEPVAAVDASPEALEQIEKCYPDIRTFNGVREMMKECLPDIVCVSTPAPTHEPISRELLNLGVSGLLIEKPLAVDGSQARKLLDDIKNIKCPLVVPHGMLVLPAPVEIKRLVRSGDLGRIISVDVQNSVDLLNGGIHWLVYLLDLFERDELNSVHAQFDTSSRRVSDAVKVETKGTTSFRLDSGINIKLSSGVGVRPQSSVIAPQDQMGALFRIVGTKGRLEFAAWSGCYWIETEERQGTTVRCAAPLDPPYHRTFLESLANNVMNAQADYHSAELSVQALEIIRSAYDQCKDSGWQIGQIA